MSKLWDQLCDVSVRVVGRCMREDQVDSLDNTGCASHVDEDFIIGPGHVNDCGQVIGHEGWPPLQPLAVQRGDRHSIHTTALISRTKCNARIGRRLPSPVPAGMTCGDAEGSKHLLR